MGKKPGIILLVVLLFFSCLFFASKSHAQTLPTPVSCGGSGCPISNITPFPNVTVMPEDDPFICAGSYEEWTNNKKKNFWVEDEEISALGKAGERSRQFLLWTLTHQSIDNHPTLLGIWSLSRNVTYFLLVVVAAIMGLGIIIGKKYNLGAKIEVWPLVFKIAFSFLFATFSAAIVLLIIQLSDTLMMFFTEKMKVNELFNIFFLKQAANGPIINLSEEAYKTFQGCKNLNINYIDSIKTSKFLINITNLIYYFVGIALIVRKIILWLLLFVSPFLAILMPFVFIRNVGWIWIGVFFQWVFYGPLFALFLGGLASIWKSPSHIPFIFDFSRTDNFPGFIYPTVINILYGGPAQALNFMNSSNYVDTFAEYIISLIMLLAVVIFPWWLLRIFRDYCCDGINAAKNILMSMYDQMRGNPPTSPQGPTPLNLTASTSLKVPKEVEIPVKTRLETVEEIKKIKTEDISRSLNLSASKITDVARFETNRQLQENVKHNLNYLTNPTKAETPTERQKYMNIRTELFNRAVKEDKVAKQILSSISTSRVEQVQRREELIKTVSQTTPATTVVSAKTNLPQQKITSINNSFINSVSSNNQLISNISQSTNTPSSQVQTILTSLKTNINQAPANIVQSVVRETGIVKEKVLDVIKNIGSSIVTSAVLKEIITKEQISKDSLEKVVEALPKAVEDNTQRSTVQILSTQTGLPEIKITSVVQSLINNAVKESSIINNISQTADLPQKQVVTALQYFSSNINQPVTNIINSLTNHLGISKEKVTSILKTTTNHLNQTKNIINDVAEKEGLTPEIITKVVQTQIPLVYEPEKHIEQTVPIPPTVSIEDYEEVKKMWVKHYEKGEVPVTENITSRHQWVDQDIVFITNTLNKLLSTDEKIKQEGFDDLGYILPIFLINNLKGDELLVYLKAKLEAAKMVGEILEKEREITERLKAKSEEELVDVTKPKEKEAEKTMEMKKELPDL